MFATNFICFYPSLILVALPLIALSTPPNKTATTDGKVVITGDHNEIVLSTAQETKKALAQIQIKIDSLKEKDEKFSQRILSLENTVQSLDEHVGRKLELMNKSNTALSVQFQAMSQRLALLEKQEKLDAVLNNTIKFLSGTIEDLQHRYERKLDVINQSNAALFAQVQAMSQRLAIVERQGGANYALLFPRKGISDYVIARGMPSLKAVTVCLWIKTAQKNGGTPLSYAVPGSDNELNLYDCRAFWLWVGTGYSRSSVSANDGKWHHICLTWENTAGSWKMYKDGKVAASGKGLKTGHVIRGGGALVLGQDQDSVGGSFDASQSFIGEMTDVNLWDHVIRDQEIMRMSKACLTREGNVFKWRDFKTRARGSVKIIKASC